MKKVSVGILAHVDAGKTTLGEAMMYLSGNLKRIGRVDRGDSFLDHYATERDRGITIFSKLARMPYGDTLFTLLDTPGHVDFSAETERTLQVLDYAILVISASDGVQSHTLTLWKLLQQYDVPTFIFVNKCDLDGADPALTIAQLKAKLSDSCADFSHPESGAFFEELAMCDEGLLDSLMENDTLSEAEITEAIRRRRLFPCCFGSALKLEGVEAFLNTLERHTAEPSYSGEFAARVYKIASDPQNNRLTFLKLTGGKLRVRDILPGANNRDGEKVTQIRLYSGEKFTAAEEITAGDVCAVTGITFACAGDGLGAESAALSPLLQPVLSYRLELPGEVDPHTALRDMRVLEAEDPMLRVDYNERLREISLRVMGDIQLEILERMIEERFGYHAVFGESGIVYKETIADTVEGVGHFEPLRHYAEVHLLLKPLARGSGLRINAKCREDMLDRNWQRLILTHLYEKIHVGVLTGSPITDIEITLVSGKAHPKHTEGGDFREASYRAVRQGLRSAQSVLLEPIYAFTIELPAENVGRAMADITRMSGSFEPPESDGELSVINGTAPVSEMRGYASEVLQYTRGRGRLSCTLQGYDVCHNADEVIAAISYRPDNDTDNPCDSVFCSHGAGHIVKWDEVTQHMHLSSALSRRETAPVRSHVPSTGASTRDIFALDKELSDIFERTYGPVRTRGENQKKPARTTLRFDQNPKKKRPAAMSGPEYLLIDGYNVIFSWNKLNDLTDDNIDAARQSLINILCNYQGYKKCELILVFDAYKIKGNTREVEEIDNIHVVYTKEAETADTYIEKVSHTLAKNHRVRVVTSDRMEQLIILGNNALYVSSEDFYDEVQRAEEEIREIISN